MKILFDQNTPRGLVRHLVGHEVTRAPEVGWSELKNGLLIQSAEAAGFELLVTCDRNLVYQQSLAGCNIAVLELSTNNWNFMKPHAGLIVQAVDQIQPGTYRSVECGAFVARKFRKPFGRSF